MVEHFRPGREALPKRDQNGPSLDVLISLEPIMVPPSLSSRKDGLTAKEAGERLRIVGVNDVVKGRPPSLVHRAARLISDPFSLLLILAGALATLSGIAELGIVIFIIVGLNAILSVLQEWRVERVMQTLRGWLPQTASVLRDGELQKVNATELVPGDVIQVEEGDRIPADARLIESYEMWTNNVPLTGESAPQYRTSQPVLEKGSSPLASPNLLFMGTSVAMGRGTAVVYGTGMSTKFGEIAALTGEIKLEPSPLQREINRAAKYDFVIALGVGSAFFLLGGLFLHLDLLSSLLLMIGVIVACVPEGLQLTISTALAVSLLEMGKQNILVKRLASVQTLGSVTVICTDKTGTITKGEMTVSKVWSDGEVFDVTGVGYSPIGNFTAQGRDLDGEQRVVTSRLLVCAMLCTNAQLDHDDKDRWTVLGDPTEGALVVAAAKFGLDPDAIREQYPRTGLLPFSSVRKSMTTFHRDGVKGLACMKGSPDTVLSCCRYMLSRQGETELDDSRLAECRRAIDDLATKGLRVLAVAYLPMDDAAPRPMSGLSDLVFAGLVGMYDPPRPEIAESVRLSHAAGIRTIIITGDYGPTAVAIAHEVGLVPLEGPMVIEGDQLEEMDDVRLRSLLRTPGVIFSRSTPHNKRRIVRTLKAMGEIVAVTGDGANDAPSLKEADVGVAMGISGTDVAREASDMVLLDDSYSSIVTAVRMGRGIYDNIKKFLTYVFTHNWAELIPYLLFGLLAIPLPLLAVQILAIDLIIDVPPSLALSREPPEPQAMERPPRSVKSRLFDLAFLARSVTLGAVIASGALLGCFHVWMEGGWTMGAELPTDSIVYMRGTTMVFAGIVVAQVANLLVSRSLEEPISRIRWKGNPWIPIGLMWMIVTLVVIIYWPPLQEVFGTAPLQAGDWGILAAIALSVLLADWAIKKIADYRAHRMVPS